jgi:HAD superfamily hydrolase (TIGR01509 family)
MSIKAAKSRVPVVAFVGLPNSGKSSLINRFCGKNTAIVANEAHTTRDLNIGYDFWKGFYIKFVDTGGLVPDPEDQIQTKVQITSWQAIAEADLLVWVVDRKQNTATIPFTTAQRIRKTGKPYILAINKVDDPRNEVDLTDYYQMSDKDIIQCSAASGYKLDELLDSITDTLVDLGFEENAAKYQDLIPDETNKRKTKVDRRKLVRKTADGGYVVYRERTASGSGLYESFEEKDLRKVPIKTIFFDIDGVLVSPHVYPSDIILSELDWGEERVSEVLRTLDTISATDANITINNLINKTLAALGSTKVVEYEENYLEEMVKASGEIDDEMFSALTLLKQNNYEIFLATNSSVRLRTEVIASKVKELGIQVITPREAGARKPSMEYYKYLLTRTDTKVGECIFVDDNPNNIESAKELGMYGVHFVSGLTDIHKEVESIERGFTPRLKAAARVLLLGRPNVGKSSLFNLLVREQIQIVTPVAGTTLSVTEHEINLRDGRKYILIDSTGVRKPSKRTFGAETFATYRTIEAAHSADVVCVVMDGSEGINAQDQLVSGILKDTKAGKLVVANKSDLVDDEQRAKFIKDFGFKLQFLKIDKFLWTVAQGSKEHLATQPSEFWKTIDEVMAQRTSIISREDVRKLFNFLMKQKPPNKLHNKKRPVIYDLLYTASKPPTFELLVKDKKTVHWSYVRFLENIIRKQFSLSDTGLIIKVVEVGSNFVKG